MSNSAKVHRGFLPRFLSICLLASLLWAQAPSPPAQTGTPASPAQTTTPTEKPSNQTTSPNHEPKISPKQAEELFRSVDEILQFASKDTGLPIKHEVKRQLASRDQVVSYLEKTMVEDKDTQRLRRSELVLKKFGLLPRDFDLQTFLVALLREQVAGYYDPETRTVNLLEWLGAEQQRPVLAHELTHALQDQSFELKKWLTAGDVDLDNIKHLTPADLDKDEIGEARQAVVEGQAMAVLVDYMLAPTGQSLLTSPEVADDLKKQMLTGSADSPEFQHAPVFLRESLTFPYRYGLDFIVQLLRDGGKEKAFAGVLANPPQSTRQIMEPKTYLSGEHLPDTVLPDFEQDFRNYERFDVGAVGELDTAVLIEQYEGADASHKLYPHWRGGYYYAARPTSDAAAPLALLYVSRWADEQHAAEFAAIYARSLAKRYRSVREESGDGKQTGENGTQESLRGTHSWLTEDGRVVIATDGPTVLVTEGFDQPTTEKLEHKLFAEPTAAK